MTSGFHATAAPASGAKNPNSDATVTTGLDSTSAIVGLSLAPLATDAKRPRPRARRLDFNSSAAKSERSKLVAQRNAFKKWLEPRPKAQVTGEYDVAVNAVAVRLDGPPPGALPKRRPRRHVGRLPGHLRPAGLSGDARTRAPADLALIRAAAVDPRPVCRGGAGRSGCRLRGPGALDHPCLGRTRQGALPPTSQQGNPAYTNNKVIIAKVFANKAAKLGFDAKAVGEHGTHVAGTVACDANTPASIDGAKIGYAPSGVAPRARLGTYNVFPGDIEDARSEDILNALDAAAATAWTSST